ncbi:unnamed protein product [Clonostachys solani]|uniref:Uncharacterized protein n=1 Tax=Clonostachys solani TaxID=160281 RepID=A0A9N9Z4V1_9HYPO|nr:unnamed protein product [Clonostachys solani]
MGGVVAWAGGVVRRTGTGAGAGADAGTSLQIDADAGMEERQSAPGGGGGGAQVLPATGTSSTCGCQDKPSLISLVQTNCATPTGTGFTRTQRCAIGVVLVFNPSFAVTRKTSLAVRGRRPR